MRQRVISDEEFQGDMVLFWRAIGGILPSLNIELIIAKALMLKGLNVCFVLCDGFLSGCMLRSVTNGRPVHRWPESCSLCYAPAIRLIKAAGIPYCCMSEFLNKNEMDKFRSLADEVDFDGPFYHNNLQIDSYAFASTTRYFKGAAPGKDEHNQILREYYYSAIVCSEAAKRIIEKLKPSHVFAQFHAPYVGWGPAIDMSISKNIPVTLWARGFFKDHLSLKNAALDSPLYSYGLAFTEYHQDLDKSLNDREDKRLTVYMAERSAGSRNRDPLFAEAPKTSDDLRRRLELPDNKPVWGIFTHVNWDAVFLSSSPCFFDDPTLWAIETIKMISEITDVTWVVKIHPAETFNPGAYGIQQAISDNFSSLPSHIKLIPSDSGINTYALLSLLDGGVTISGTVGLEMALRYQPVIIDARTFYGGKGFTYDSRDKEHYFELLKEAHNLLPLSQKQVQQARRFAYEYFIERQIPFAEFISKEGAQIKAKSINDLRFGQSKILDMICEKILYGGEFLLNDQDRRECAGKINNQGNKLFSMGNKESAIQSFATALEIDPLFTTAHNNLGTIYWEKKDINKAIAHFGKALSISPYDRGIVLNFGKILTVLKKSDDAKKLFSAYLTRHPQDGEIKRLLENLEKMGEQAVSQNTANTPSQAQKKSVKLELPPQVLILLTNPRSGSTWLSDAIRCHPAIEYWPHAHLYRVLGFSPGARRYPRDLSNRPDAVQQIEVAAGGQWEKIPKFELSDIIKTTPKGFLKRPYAIEKIHPEFFRYDVQAFLRKLDKMEKAGLKFKLIYQVRDPKASMTSFMNYQKRVPTWYPHAKGGVLVEYMQKTYDTMLEVFRLREGLVVDYGEIINDLPAALGKIYHYLWPDMSPDEADFTGQVSQGAASATARGKRKKTSDSSFLGEKAGPVQGTSEEYAEFFTRHRDKVELCYNSYTRLFQ